MRLPLVGKPISKMFFFWVKFEHYYYIKESTYYEPKPYLEPNNQGKQKPK